MRYIFNFPDIGEGLDEGTIVEWYVAKGQSIQSGDALLKMETDKVVTDIPCPKTGVVAAMYGKVGEVVKVGEPLVEIEMPGVEGAAAVEEVKKELVEEAVEEGGAGVVGTLEIAGSSAYLPSSNEGLETPPEEKVAVKKKALATPVARALAKELGVDIDQVKGTGPGNRVMTDDIRKYSEGSQRVIDQARSRIPDLGERITYEPLSQIRKTIAKNMINSKHNAAHMTIHEEVEISELVRVRDKYKVKFAEKGIKLSYLPFILKATAQALKKHRQLNSQLDLENNRMIYKNYYNIGIAVDTEDGLVVPVIHDADKLSILELAQKVNELAEKARTRKLTMDDMKDGTFTITSYGSIGGLYAVPVINYPQAGILGIGRIIERPVFKGDNVVKGIMMPLSLSVDHRIVDGGEVSRFVNTVMGYLNEPVSLVIE
ncbi:MAG: dihydrolipoamide acetyltransferase family protein [Bacteroidota bacterium]